MKRFLLPVVTVVVVSLVPVVPEEDPEQREFESWILALPPAKIHELVVAVEQDPLGETAEMRRAALLTYFDEMPTTYEACASHYGPVLDSRNKLHKLVWLQAVLGSGDFVVQHPDQATDREAYMLAGLESALRAYERLVVQRPKARMPFLDGLLALRSQGTLVDHIRAHPCDKK